MLLPRIPSALVVPLSLCLPLLAAVASQAAAPPAALVKDVATGAPLPYLPNVRDHVAFARLGDRLYFSAEDGIHGRELWSTDGTASGTEIVADVCPGYCFGWASHLTVVGDRLFFYGDDGAHGAELWTSDGTAAGTRLVADIVPGIDPSSPIWLTASGDRLFFVARDPEHGSELWVSDGTATGTRLVADLASGETSSQPDRLTALPGGVFFTADDGVHGREPWFSDGTAAGTQLLGDLRTAGDGLSITSLQGFLAPTFRDWAPLANRVVFAARDDQHGQELWSTDGTPSGTALLADLADDGAAGGSNPRSFTEMDGRLYFSARTPDHGGELWVTDGISDTHVVSELVAGNPSSRTSATPLGSAGDWLYFSGFTEPLGSELWRTDGTTANTHLVVDAVPGPLGALGWSFVARGVALGSRFVFYAEDPSFGVEPWITDGTASGTGVLRDVYPGTPWSNPLIFVELAVLDGRALFFALDLLHGFEPWVTDGTEAGTQPLLDIDDQVSALLPCFWFHCNAIGAVGDRLFAGLHDPQSGEEPWMSRGTPGTTRLIADLRPATTQGFAESSFPWGFAGVGGTALFSARTGDDSGGSAPSELWRSDGSEAGTWMIPGPEEADLFTSALGAVFFRASTPDSGSELWISDGETTGTRMVADLLPGPAGSGPQELTEAAGHLFFSAWDDDAGWELWASDGNEAGTARLADLWPGIDSSAPRGLTASDERLFFSAETMGAGRELWVTDGTEAGTRGVIDLQPGPDGAMRLERQPGLVALPQIAAGDGGVFFLGDDGVHGTEPWWSDGSEAGTRSLGDLRPGPVSSRPRFLTSVGGRAFFAADDGAHGRELWTSDGTEAGTRMVLDLVPGEGSSLPQWLTPVDGLLYFTARRPDVGLELWRTDGTEAGTELVADVFPGAEPSTPEFLTVAGRRLFFTANDGEHGFEPWALLLPGRLPRLSLSADGATVRGGEVQLTAVLHNPPPVALPDAEGDELVLPLPAGLVFLAGEATSGDLAFQPAAAATAAGTAPAAATSGGGVVTWNGSLPAGGTVTVTVRARLLPEVLSGTVLTLAAEGWLDSDADGAGDHRFAGDDPRLPGEEDPTTIVVAPLALDVPALHPAGLLLLAAALGLLALRRLDS